MKAEARSLDGAFFPTHLPEIMGQLWEDASKGRVLLCSSAKESLLQGVVSAPLARVPKMNPDRTMAESGRMVWDGGLQNKSCPKEDHPPAYQPRHGTVARCIIYYQLHFPGIPVRISKKDISEAFKWLWLWYKSVK